MGNQMSWDIMQSIIGKKSNNDMFVIAGFQDGSTMIHDFCF
jgi:hypothetical protein